MKLGAIPSSYGAVFDTNPISLWIRLESLGISMLYIPGTKFQVQGHVRIPTEQIPHNSTETPMHPVIIHNLSRGTMSHWDILGDG